MRRLISYILLLFVVLLSQFTFVYSQSASISQEKVAKLNEEITLAKQFAAEQDFNQAAFYYGKVANTYWQHDMLMQAAENFLLALEMSDKLGNNNAVYIISTNLGLIYTDTEEYDKALEQFLQAAAVASKLGRKADVTSSYINQANIYYEKGNYSNALNALNTANAIAQELNEPKLLRNIYSVFTKVYDKQGNIEESAKYFNLFSAITKKIQQDEFRVKEEAARQLVDDATSRVKHVEAQKQATEQELMLKDEELTQKQRVLEEAERESRERLMQIDLLNKERELQQAVITHQNQMRNIYLAIIVLVLFFTAYVLYSYYQKKRANLLLQQKNEEIVRQNGEIQQQAEQLRELNSLKDKLFSIISHDLRSPLGSLITLLNLTQQGFFTEEGFKEVIDELSKNVGYTSELLENLLKWAQSQMQGLKVNPTKFKVRDIAQSKLNLYAEQAHNKGITLRNLVEEDVEVFADSAMIELVFRNLIANAIKFCEKGSAVTVSASIKNSDIMVSVADTGVGMNSDQLHRLFGREIFSTRGTQDEKGTGLGLILCKDFITLNNGDIWVKSIEGVGSEFFFTIPLAQRTN